jgi:hypothetical protein
MPSNLQNAEIFFTYWQNTPKSTDIDAMMGAIFSISSPNTLPTLGIAAGSDGNNPNQWQGPQLGPQFVGVSDVTACFNQIITSFPKAKFTTLPKGNPVYLQDENQTQVAVPAVLNTGTQQAPWFQAGSKGYSKPLSDIQPDTNQQSIVPACTIFTFDNSNRITNLAIFMDRWQMAVDLWPNPAKNAKSTVRPFPAPI